MKGKNAWMLVIGALILLVVINKVRAQNETKAGAFGKQCQCQGKYTGTCVNWFGIGDCCDRKCAKIIRDTID